MTLSIIYLDQLELTANSQNKTNIINGMPQGSVISPTLFNLFSAKETVRQQSPLNTSFFSFFFFFDDCSIWRTGKQI